MEIKELDGYKLVKCTRKELKTMKASDYADGDVIVVENRYWIYIRYQWNSEKYGYRKYDIPSLLSYVELENGKTLDSTPGGSVGFTPYYIDDFKGR